MECLHCFKNPAQILHHVDLLFLNFLSDQRNSMKAVCKTCKDKDGKVSMMHFKVLRTAERHTVIIKII
jgi:hypothetical protein